MKRSKVRTVPVATARNRRRYGVVMGRWSNLATHHPVRRIGCRILEQKATKETKWQPRFEIGTSLSSFPSVQNPGQSRLIKANRAIFPCFDMTTALKTAKFRNCQLPRSVRSVRSDRSDLPPQSEIRNPKSAIGVAPSRTPFSLLPLSFSLST